MKKISFTFMALLLVFQSPRMLANDRPAISVQEAVAIAEKAKTLRANGDSVFIESVTLHHTSLLNSKRVWIVKWSGKLEANDPRDHEVGLEIAMDGQVKHIVKGFSDK